LETTRNVSCERHVLKHLQIGMSKTQISASMLKVPCQNVGSPCVLYNGQRAHKQKESQSYFGNFLIKLNLKIDRQSKSSQQRDGDPLGDYHIGVRKHPSETVGSQEPLTYLHGSQMHVRCRPSCSPQTSSGKHPITLIDGSTRPNRVNMYHDLHVQVTLSQHAILSILTYTNQTSKHHKMASSTIRICMLNADIPVPNVFAKRAPTYGRIFHTLLQSASPDITIESTDFDIMKQQYPDSLDHFDTIIVSGSANSAYDDFPWIHRLDAYIKHVYATEPRVKIFGSCFGHQIICQSLLKSYGVRVEQDPNGWEIGVHDITLKRFGGAKVWRCVRK
jgi:hypothetical protein